MQASLGALTVDLIANTAGFERGMDKAERALQRQEKAADRLAASIDPVTGAMQKLTAQQIKLDELWQKKVIPDQEYKRLSGILAENEKALKSTGDQITKTNAALSKSGLTAKQLSNNLRGVPAQFTDIAVSLQSGQAPLTVLLQQGGQLKDMFGGIGPAARALGGYVLGLVNPFTVAAAAAAVLALAYKQGSDETTAFTKALILNGNAAGTNADALASQAQSVSQSVGTVGAAARVLAQLAASGKIPASSFDTIAIAALKMEEATGKAAEETVKDFEKLAKDPVKYSKELNDSLNYLTTSTYAQIEALQRQGDAQGAANLAESAYAEALTTRANSIKDNLGFVESAWLSVKNAAKDAWDAFLDIGREGTIEQKLKVLNDRLQEIANADAINNSRGSGGFLAPSDDLRREQTEKEITDLLVQQEESRKRAQVTANVVAQDKKGINAVAELNKALDETAPKTDKLAKRFAEIDKQVAAAAARGVQYSDAQIAQLRKAAEEQYKAAASPKPKAFREDAGQKMLDSLRQQAAALQVQSDTTEKLGVQAKALAAFEQQIADIKSKDIQTADQKSILASEDLLRAQLKRNVALEQEVAARKQATDEAAKLAAFQENQASKLQGAQEGLDSQLTGLGQGDKLRERLKENLAIQKEYQDESDKLSRDFNSIANPTQAQTDLYQAETDALGEALAARLVMQQDYYNQVDEASKNLFIGLSESWNDYLAQATDVSAQTQTLFDGAFSGLTDALYGFVTTGKLSFQDLAASFAQTALKMLIQYAAAQAIAAGLNAFTSTAAIPIIGPLAAPAAAASALAYAGGLSASIAGIAGMAHDGIDSVPQTGTWLLQKGERVTTAQTSAKLDKTLNDIKSPSGMGGTTVNLIENPDRAGERETRTGPNGEEQLDVFVADLLGDGKTAQAFERKYNLQTVGR
ncbi:Prophage tail length tape measure protein [compost metagenome]